MRLGLGLGLSKIRQSGAAAFSPSSIFGGTQGFWFEPSTSNSFQNSNGTTAVASGDPVGYTTDLSGFGNHATQATGGSRPTLSSATGYAGWLLDGTDDWLALTPRLVAGGAATMVFAVNAATGQLSKTVYGEGYTGNTSPFYTFRTDTSTGSKATGFYRADGSVQYLADAAFTSPPTAFDSSARIITVRDTGTNFQIRVDAGAWTSASYTRTTTTTIDQAAIGAIKRSTAANFFGGTVYSAFGVAKSLSDSDIASLEKYFGARVGKSF